MQLSDIRTHVRRLVGEVTSSGKPFWSNTEVDDGIHWAEQFVGSMIRRPEALATFKTVANQREYTTLAAGTYLVGTTSYDGYILKPEDYRNTIEPSVTTGRPTRYYLREQGRQIVVGLYPTPTAAKTVTCLVTREPTKPATDSTHSEIPDMWMGEVVLYAGMWLKLRDKEFREARALVDEMLRNLAQALLNTRQQQHEVFDQVRDMDNEGPDLYKGRLWIP